MRPPGRRPHRDRGEHPRPHDRHESRDRHDREPAGDIVYGRWPVREALESGPVAKVLFAKGVGGAPIDEIMELAKRKHVPYHWVERRQLDQLAGANHQGVAAHVAALSFADFDFVLKKALAAPKDGVSLLFLDGIQDPQNLGSVLRTAAFFNVPGVVIPKWRAASLTSTVVRASAGAARLIPVAQVSNIASAMETARQRGLWLIGADMDGVNARTADVPRPLAVVMGSEGEGLHRLVREKCDMIVGISGSTRPGVGSLNVGVACGVLLHQFS